MQTPEKIYAGLCVLFAVFIVTGNLIYQKFVQLPILPFHTFELSVGAILYPFTFLITDLITEFYGKNKASFCVKMALAMNITIALFISGMDHLNATSWSKVTNETFHHVFGAYGVAFIGSVLACYLSQWLDIRLYLGIKHLTKNRWLWIRNNGSTAISLFIDTAVVIGFMTAFGVFPVSQMNSLIINSYLFKLFFVICSTPLFYIGVWVIKRMMDKNKDMENLSIPLGHVNN